MNTHCDKNYSVNNFNYNDVYIKFIFKKINEMDKYIKKEDINDKKIRLSLYELSI